MKNASILSVCGLAALLFAGCATSYPEGMALVKDSFVTPDVPGGGEFPACVADDGNRLLRHLETGRLLQLKGDYAGSSKAYEAAINYCDNQEMKALHSVGEAAQKLEAASYGNELDMDYPVTGFERMMLHQMDAFNRLALGDWDSAGVDVRNIAKARNAARDIYRRDLAALTNEIAKVSGDETTLVLQGLNARLTRHLESSLQNAYTSWFSGLYYEESGELDDALTAYRDALEAYPGNIRVTRDIARVRKKQAGLYVAPKDAGDVVVIIEEGFVPAKSAQDYSCPAVLSTLVESVPVYDPVECDLYAEPDPLFVTRGGKLLSCSLPVCDFRALAAKTHAERIGMILARQRSRSITKAVVQGLFNGMMIGGLWIAANCGGGDRNPLPTIGLALAGAGFVGGGLTSIYTVVSERADQRSWLLLPRSAGVCRFRLKTGTHALTLRHGENSLALDVPVEAGRTTIVHCTSIPGEMKASVTVAGRK